MTFNRIKNSVFQIQWVLHSLMCMYVYKTKHIKQAYKFIDMQSNKEKKPMIN